MIFFELSKKLCFLGIFGPLYCGIGATICIGREMLCLPYAGFFEDIFPKDESVTQLLSNGGICRTAPATPGLLKIALYRFYFRI